MRQSVSHLAERWGDSLYRAAFAVCRNPQDAEDVVQETLLAYFRSDKQFESDEHIRAWLIRVAVNKARNATICFWRRNRRSLEETLDALTYEDAADRDLLDAVLRLPERYRIVIHLFYYEDYSIREIAKLLKLSEGAVKSRLSRGRKLLRGQLTEEWDDEQS